MEVNRPTFRDKLLHLAFWNIYGLVKYIPPPVGDVLRALVLKVFSKRFRSWHVREGVTIWYPDKLDIGPHCSLNEWVYIIAYGGVSIGEGVRIAARASILTNNHRFSDPEAPIREQGWAPQPVRIEDDVWIGINATILAGVTVGRGAVVAAGAVVSKDVPPFSIVAGVPAHVVSWRKQPVQGDTEKV